MNSRCDGYHKTAAVNNMCVGVHDSLTAKLSYLFRQEPHPLRLSLWRWLNRARHTWWWRMLFAEITAAILWGWWDVKCRKWSRTAELVLFAHQVDTNSPPCFSLLSCRCRKKRLPKKHEYLLKWCRGRHGVHWCWHADAYLYSHLSSIAVTFLSIKYQ